MANFVSGDWVIAFRNGDRNSDTLILGKKRYIHLKLTLPSGDTWPKAGLPMPSAGSAGMTRNLDGYILHQAIDTKTFTTGITTASGAAKVFYLNTTGNRLHAYHILAGTGTGLTTKRATSGDGAIKALTFFVTAIGW